MAQAHHHRCRWWAACIGSDCGVWSNGDSSTDSVLFRCSVERCCPSRCGRICSNPARVGPVAVGQSMAAVKSIDFSSAVYCCWRRCSQGRSASAAELTRLNVRQPSGIDGHQAIYGDKSIDRPSDRCTTDRSGLSPRWVGDGELMADEKPESRRRPLRPHQTSMAGVVARVRHR